MSKVIHKYQLTDESGQLQTEVTLTLPEDYTLLRVADQRGFPNIWALHTDPAKYRGAMVNVKLTICGTGWTIPDDIAYKIKYVGTFDSAVGNLVFHVFEEVNNDG